MKTLFLIKKRITNKRGTTPIRCRFTISKTRKEFSTGIFIHPEYWDKDKQKVLDEIENSKTVNSQLSLIKQKLSQAFFNAPNSGRFF